MERLHGTCWECEAEPRELVRLGKADRLTDVCAQCLRKALAMLTPDSELEAIVVRAGGQEYRVTVEDLAELARRRTALRVPRAAIGVAMDGSAWVSGTGGGPGASGSAGVAKGGGGALGSVVVPVGGRGGRGEVRVTQCDSEPAANTSRAGDLTEAQLDRLESEAHAGLSTPGGHGGGYHERRHQLLALVAEVRRHRQ